jgi:hypothetical protein
MSRINDTVDYGSILFPEDGKNRRKKNNKNPRAQETKNSRIQEVRSKNMDKLKKPRTQENKKSREVVDGSGRIRRPANITLQDDVKEALDILAAKRRVRPWKLLDQALREFLEKEGIKLDAK